jgi:hypothetical protein
MKAGDVRDVAESGASSDPRQGNGFIALASDSGLSAVFRCTDAKAAAEVAAAVDGLA